MAESTAMRVRRTAISGLFFAGLDAGGVERSVEGLATGLLGLVAAALALQELDDPVSSGERVVGSSLRAQHLTWNVLAAAFSGSRRSG
jgi:hypothetical protein